MRLRNPLITFWDKREVFFQHTAKDLTHSPSSTVYKTYGFEYYTWGSKEGDSHHLHINIGYHFWEWEW